MGSIIQEEMHITIGVLALQGAFNEHIHLLHQAAGLLSTKPLLRQPSPTWTFLQVRTAPDLVSCDALIIPGGESTAIALVAQRSHLLAPLRAFVTIARKPTWGTCAGLILLAQAANHTMAGGQELIGGLDVRVNRNHFGRQAESFQADLELPFLRGAVSGVAREGGGGGDAGRRPFKAIFIRAPIVEEILPVGDGVRGEEGGLEAVVAAPSCELAHGGLTRMPVEILATLPGRTAKLAGANSEAGDIVAVRQGNVFGTSFHPELTGDARIHVWWLEEVVKALEAKSAR